MIQALLDRHVQSGAIAGAVALVTVGETEAVTTAGVQDLETEAPMRPDTIFRIMSMTKPTTAAAAMILVEDERLALEDEVAPASGTGMGGGYGGAVVTCTNGAGPPVGSYGWSGGYGTHFTIDPHSGTIALLLTECRMTGADDGAIATELGRIVFSAANKGENRP